MPLSLTLTSFFFLLSVSASVTIFLTSYHSLSVISFIALISFSISAHPFISSLHQFLIISPTKCASSLSSDVLLVSHPCSLSLFPEHIQPISTYNTSAPYLLSWALYLGGARKKIKSLFVPASANFSLKF